MSLYIWEGKILFRNGRLAKSEACCCIDDDGISTCGCDNLPETLYLYAADGTFLTELHYVADMVNIPGGLPGWEANYDGGVVEFYCLQVTLGGGTVEERWNIDDQEGGQDYVLATNCTGVLATFPTTVMGEVYVSTEPPP